LTGRVPAGGTAASSSQQLKVPGKQINTAAAPCSQVGWHHGIQALSSPAHQASVLPAVATPAQRGCWY
jgi:hypothetical protein